MSALALLCALSTTAGATQYAELLDLDDLAGRADRVVLGEVLTTRVESQGNGIWTVATVMVDETLSGDRDPVVEVRVPGGRLSNLELTVVGVPKLVPGYEMLLFLDDDRIVGLGQGAFVVAGGYAWRNLDDDNFMSPSVDREWVNELDPSDSYRAFRMTEVRRATR